MVTGAGAAMLAGTVTRRALDAGWKAATSDEPPDKPESLGINWREALLWTAISAVVVGVASGLYPAWRGSRLTPSHALNG
jgi:hypothetical protein